MKVTKNKFYSIWRSMNRRCYGLNSKDYKYYGGRGITVCTEWRSAENFIEWAESTHPNIDGYSLDRIDTNKQYSPENCTWSDKTTQCVNRNIMQSNTTGYSGVRWVEKYQIYTSGISFENVKYHLGSFLTKEEAVLTRDQYIVDNKLPHKLSNLYVKGNTYNFSRVYKNSSSGYTGIYWHSRDLKWVATVTSNKVTHNLGYFDTIEEAIYKRDTYIIENNLSNRVSGIHC
jgi:hypothetical protein